MKRLALVVLLAAGPVCAQESSSSFSPTLFEFDFAAERMSLSVPFGSSGPVMFGPTVPALGMRLNYHGWYVDFAGQLMDRRLRQRRIATTLMRSFVTTNRFNAGMEIDYWELGFRHRVATVQETGVETYRQGRTILVGPYLQVRGPRSLIFGASATGGWYRNDYDSVIVVTPVTLTEPLVRDETAIGKIQLGIQTGLIAQRIRLSGSVRYLRVLGGHSSWIPASEISGDGRFDIRLITRRNKSIFIGAYMRFGPTTPGLVSDKTFGIRGTAKLR